MELTALNTELLKLINLLTDKQKELLLAFIYSIVKPKQYVKPSILSFASYIPEKELDAMEDAISKDCSNIDEDGW